MVLSPVVWRMSEKEVVARKEDDEEEGKAKKTKCTEKIKIKIKKSREDNVLVMYGLDNCYSF